jgi:hypothetical protein
MDYMKFRRTVLLIVYVKTATTLARKSTSASNFVYFQTVLRNETN